MSSISENNEDNIKQSSMWWLKSTVRTVKPQNPQINIPNLTSPNKQLEIEISSSIDEYLEKDPAYRDEDASEADIGSIIEEINKLAVYDTSATDKSVEEIMQEAEKLYLESSKSFEQLSSKSKSSVDYSLSMSNSFRSKKSTSSSKSSHNLKTNDYKTLERQSERDEIELNNNENNEFPPDVNDNDQIDYELEFEKDDSEKEFFDNRSILDQQDKNENIELHLDELPVEKELIEPEVMEESPDPEPEILEEDVEELHQEIEALKYLSDASAVW